jgi:entericidin A
MERTMQKYSSPLRLIALCALFAILLGATACNTMHGLGEDLSQLGDKITDKADQHNDNK